MAYRIVVTLEAENDLDRYVKYLLFEKKSEQAAKNVLDDFEEMLDELAIVAESLKLCENPKLKRNGYRRILKHRYFMMYRVEEDLVIVDNIFHEL